MKKLINYSLTSFLVLSVLGCNLTNPNSNNKSNEKVISLERSNQTEVFEAKVSDKKGAEIYFTLNSPKTSSDFTTKANSDGTLAKVAADVDQYMIYLISDNSTTGFPAGGDPLGSIVTGGGPFTIPNTGTGTPTSKTVRFSGVPILATGAYYVAVRAQETGPVTDLIKDNNGSGTAWTNTTAGITLKVAVSNGNGITVDSNFAVNSTTPLAVTPQLIDGTGAIIEATITPADGSLNSINATGI